MEENPDFVEDAAAVIGKAKGVIVACAEGCAVSPASSPARDAAVPPHHSVAVLAGHATPSHHCTRPPAAVGAVSPCV